MKRQLMQVFWVLSAAMLVGALLLLSIPAKAEAVGVLTDGKITVALYDDACKLKAVSNLAYRATWTENGKTSEGCWGMSPPGIVVAYWESDRTIAVMPAHMFQRPTAI